MKRILIFTLTLIIAIAAVAAPQQRRGPGPGPGAQERGDGGPGRGPRGGGLSPEALADFLDLTEAQIAQADALRETQRAAIEPLREQMRANREALEAAIASGNAQQIGEATLAGKAIRDQIKAAHDAFETSFAALLTASQKAKWDVYQELASMRGGRPDGPRRGGPGV